jgi:hypothetical protein
VRRDQRPWQMPDHWPVQFTSPRIRWSRGSPTKQDAGPLQGPASVSNEIFRKLKQNYFFPRSSSSSFRNALFSASSVRIDSSVGFTGTGLAPEPPCSLALLFA